MRTRGLLASLAAVAVLAGCGGDDRLSEDEYRERAAQVCREGERESDAVEEPTRATNAAIVDYFERLLAANEASTDRFKELEPPEDLQDAHDAAVKANEDGAVAVREIIADLEDGGDARQILSAAQGRLQDLRARAVEAAQDLGVPACGQGS